mmetsp:Transcript_25219/g.37145  ORF Transcript_25219/g.37145 Transcript_25219/m.37145 type:complete len:142 (+) Transcript_25219:83-508(+)|eukprot:CAMPEP_0195522658 /NCGR_PEP_ID=MMETSP0794_2-20130614/21025_1 /TAXON_ID=515487 /ORGANISM="Stephanopyxis turris, Strain CCMP 815" /LENGTH=141 /DNA_ID=CAMNT_0040652461 /DNA_START=71 /DNA_END=496 /DNA_ORIENTATION=-
MRVLAGFVASRLCLSSAFAPTSSFVPRASTYARSSSTALSGSGKPFCIVVEAEIKQDRMDEFLDLIEKDAVGSRGEPGCIRFDVLRSQDNPNKFFFYEAYTDADAVAFHKDQPHFALWTNFKESGGVVSSVSHKTDGWFMS